LLSRDGTTASAAIIEPADVIGFSRPNSGGTQPTVPAGDLNESVRPERTSNTRSVEHLWYPVPGLKAALAGMVASRQCAP